MRSWGIIWLCAAAMIVGACGSSTKTVQRAAGSSSVTSTTAAAGAVAPTTSTTAAQAAGKATATTAKAAAATGANQNTATASHSSSGSASSGSASASASSVGSRPGTYTYDVTGSATGGTPPQTKAINSKGTAVIDAPIGTTQHIAIKNEQGNTTVEETLNYISSQVQLTDLKVDQLNLEFKPNPPVEGAPIPYVQGAHWTWDMTSTDGKTTAHGDYTITGQEMVVTASHQSVNCYIISDTITFHGSYNGAPVTVTQTDTTDSSQDLRLQVRIHTVTDAGAFGKSDTTSLLESTSPS